MNANSKMAPLRDVLLLSATLSTMQNLLTIDEAAKRLKLNPETVRRQLRSGVLRGIKRGKMWRIPESAIYESGAPGSRTDEAQAQAVLSDLQSRDGNTRNKAILALGQAAPGVRAIVQKAADKAAREYYATPEGRDELADWATL
jgi:excisionase family DNA binding protein